MLFSRFASKEKTILLYLNGFQLSGSLWRSFGSVWRSSQPQTHTIPTGYFRNTMQKLTTGRTRQTKPTFHTEQIEFCGKT